MTTFPIDEILPHLLESIKSHNNIILHAPPGAGKTTRVPLALLDIITPEMGRIIILEPRRIAAVAAARWMAKSCGEEVGEKIGYSIRFDSCTSQSTRIEVVTEGILTRRIQSDPLLADVALVIFDEFHERSLHADLGLVLCREAQQLRPELKIMVMSATLDLQSLSSLLGNAPVISSAGRSFPVEIKYFDEFGNFSLADRMANAVIRALNETEGDILAFLPGFGEIRATAARLADTEVMQSIALCQLYGDLPVSEQQQVIQPGSRRKVVLATSIAETSLTIEGVRVVIDCGLSRRLQFDPGNGLNRLVTVRESRASAEQRAGRAGRTAPGVCYRLYSRHTLQTMTPHTPPEISVTDLSQLVLELAAWGITDHRQPDWPDAPPVTAVESARRLLLELDLIDENFRISTLGREVVSLPLHPRLGRLLLRSRELHSPVLGCQIAALLSERDIFRHSTGTPPMLSNSDMVDRLELLKLWRTTGGKGRNIDLSTVRNVERVVSQLRRIMRISNSETDYSADDNIISRLLLAAYPDRIARRRSSGSSYLLTGGRAARISDRSAVRYAEYLVAVTLDAGNQAEAVIHLAHGISETVIREERLRHIRYETMVYWDDREGRVIAKRMELLGNIELASNTIVPSVAESKAVTIGALRAARLSFLKMNDAVEQLRGRLTLLRSTFPDYGWPDFSDAALCETVEEWLDPHLDGVNSAQRAAELDIAAILKQSLNFRQQKELDELTPPYLSVPGGSRIRIDYATEVPVLAVKLQELFGLGIVPTVCGGRVPLLLHLLSPAGRPIQVTRDLKGFWDCSYQQVKKELKGRYPKHPWPDDPWSAVPTGRPKPRH